MHKLIAEEAATWTYQSDPVADGIPQCTDGGRGLLKRVILQKWNFMPFDVWIPQLDQRRGHDSLQQEAKDNCSCRRDTSPKKLLRIETQRTMNFHLVQPLEVPVASVRWRANVLYWCAELRNMVGEDEAGWQEAGDKHLADLNKTRVLLIDFSDFRVLERIPNRKSYPGDSCVENQTATSLQDQHGIDVLKNNKEENWEMVSQNTCLIASQ